MTLDLTDDEKLPFARLFGARSATTVTRFHCGWRL
jgi:hypothetical protein